MTATPTLSRGECRRFEDPLTMALRVAQRGPGRVLLATPIDAEINMFLLNDCVQVLGAGVDPAHWEYTIRAIVPFFANQKQCSMCRMHERDHP